MDELNNRREELLGLLASGEAELRTGGRPDMLRLGELRWRFTRALAGYQSAKHGCILDPAIAAGGAEAALAVELKARCLAVAGELRRFSRAWDAKAILDEPDGYRAMAAAMIARLRGLLLADADGIARLLAPPLAA